MIARSTFSNGIVLCCRSDDDDSLLAVKCIDIDECPTSSLVLLQHEVALTRTINHPNIHTYSSVWLSKSRLCMSSPFMDYGSCADIISSHFKHGLPEKIMALILFEILTALSYLRSVNLIHRGIRCSHILVSKNGEIKLSGHRNMIELSRDGIPVKKVHDFPKHDSSMLPWLSPEILQQDMQGYCTKSDIYSLGITACELANGYAPFTDMPSTQMLLEKLNGTIPFMLDETTVAPLIEDNRIWCRCHRLDITVDWSKKATMPSDSFDVALNMFDICCLERLFPLKYFAYCSNFDRHLLGDKITFPFTRHCFAGRMKGPSANADTEKFKSEMIKAAKSRKFSTAMHQLVTDCLERDPDMRMDAEQLLKHPVFRQLKGLSKFQILQPVFEKMDPISKRASARVFQEQEEMMDGLNRMTICDVEWDFQE